MATPRSMVEEAADPTTPGPRLLELVDSPDDAVAALAKRNPSLPEERLRALLRSGSSEGWSNIQVPLLLLTTPNDRGLFDGATELALRGPPADDATREQLRPLLRQVLEAGWRDLVSDNRQTGYLGWVVSKAGPRTDAHRLMIRVALIGPVEAMSLAEKDRQQIQGYRDAVEHWLAGNDGVLQAALASAKELFKRDKNNKTSPAHAVVKAFEIVLAGAIDAHSVTIDNAWFYSKLAAGIAESGSLDTARDDVQEAFLERCRARLRKLLPSYPLPAWLRPDPEAQATAPTPKRKAPGKRGQSR